MSTWNKKKTSTGSTGNSSWNGNATKKPRFAPAGGGRSAVDSQLTSQDDEEMMDLGDDDMDVAFVESESQLDDDLTGCLGQEEESTTITYGQWERPPVDDEFHPKTSSLIFQQLDMDHYIRKAIPGMPGAKLGPVPVIR
jgi:hypothetical protein